MFEAESVDLNDRVRFKVVSSDYNNVILIYFLLTDKSYALKGSYSEKLFNALQMTFGHLDVPKEEARCIWENLRENGFKEIELN